MRTFYRDIITDIVDGRLPPTVESISYLGGVILALHEKVLELEKQLGERDGEDNSTERGRDTD